MSKYSDEQLAGMAKTLGDRRTPFMDWLDQRESGGAPASTELSSRADALDREMARKLQEADGGDVMSAAANQEPIKNETPANTGDSADSDAGNQEPIKNADLASIFTGLASRGLAKSRAKQAAAVHPQAEQIAYVQENFHDILIQLMESGKLEVNGSKTVTEDNKTCL